MTLHCHLNSTKMGIRTIQYDGQVQEHSVYFLNWIPSKRGKFKYSPIKEQGEKRAQKAPYCIYNHSQDSLLNF